MEDEGVIKNYYTVIDSYKLGYTVYRYYLVLQSANLSIREKLLNELSGYQNTFVVASLKGRYDLSVLIWVKSVPEFYRFWDDINDKYGDYFAEKVFSIYVQAFTYRRSYLVPQIDTKKDRDQYEIIGIGGTVKIDNLDYQLLNEISTNARAPLIHLAQKLNHSPQSVKYRMDNLMKSGVIQGFRTGFDIRKLGFDEFKVDISLKTPTKRKTIINYLKYKPHIVCLSTSAGYVDIEIEFEIENSDKMIQVMDDVQSKFPGTIKKYTYFGKTEFHKIRCLPEFN
jgi:DNA-binding Lrp family transcriptional regulator